jgi:hypothetical protein
MEAAVRSKASQQRVTFNLDSETEHSLKDLDARAHSNAERAHSNAELQAHQSDRSKSPPPVRSQMSLSPEPQGRAISAPALSDGTAWITERIAMEEDGRFKGAKRHQDIAMMHIHKVCWKICARLCATQTSHLPVLTVMQRNDNCCRANRRAPWLPARLRNKETMTASSPRHRAGTKALDDHHIVPTPRCKSSFIIAHHSANPWQDMKGILVSVSRPPSWDYIPNTHTTYSPSPLSKHICA